MGTRVFDQDDALSLGVRKGLEEHGIDDREDGRIGSDAEGQGGDRRCGKARIAAEAAEGESQVVQKCFHGKRRLVRRLYKW